MRNGASGSVVQLVLLGLLGEYMGRIYGEVSAGHSIWSRSGGGSRPLAGDGAGRTCAGVARRCDG